MKNDRTLKEMGRLVLTGVSLLALVLILGACGGTPTSTPTPTPTPTSTPISGQASVDISSFTFAPQTLTVTVGTTVTWTNNDSAPHTVTSKNDVFDSPTLSRGDTFSYTFDQKGTFDYYCKIHTTMTAKIIVE